MQAWWWLIGIPFFSALGLISTAAGTALIMYLAWVHTIINFLLSWFAAARDVTPASRPAGGRAHNRRRNVSQELPMTDNGNIPSESTPSFRTAMSVISHVYERDSIPHNCTSLSLTPSSPQVYEQAILHCIPRSRLPAPDLGLCVLSIDGGGVRGYIALLILRFLLRILQPRGLIYPCEWFDLICGTSTGGLIAILLGTLHLDIDNAIKVYQDLARDIFFKGPSSWRYLSTDSWYSQKPLKSAIDRILKAHGQGRTLMYDPEKDMGCRSFITTTHCVGKHQKVFPVRSYRIAGSPQCVPEGHQWTIEDAALATTAAPTYFRRHAINRGEVSFYFEDAGAHLHNNPTKLAREECLKLGGLHNSLFISLGTGTAPRIVATPRGSFLFGSKRAMIKGVLRHATDVEGVHKEMEGAATSEMSYFRLNPPNLGDIDLAAYQQLPAMEQGSDDYFQSNQIQFHRCADQLRRFQQGMTQQFGTVPLH